MKLRILWVLSGLWTLVFLYLSSESFQHAWRAEGSVFNLGQKLEALLAAVGAITIGALPPYVTYRLHRFHKSRERYRLEKERARIDRKLEKIDRRQGLGGAPEPPQTRTSPVAPSSSA
jgi:hypothetical protein